MTDHERAYYAALQRCGERYRLMIDDLSGMLPRKKLVNLSQFVAGFNYACRERTVPVPKLCRWLGYIQGVLIEHDLTTVNVERDWTRPLFRPLDYPTEPCESGVHFPGREPTVGEII